METKHNLNTQTTELTLSPKDVEIFRTDGELSARHIGTGNKVDIFKISVMQSNVEEVRHFAPSANFDPNGNLSIALPMRHDQVLELPLTIPAEAIGQSPQKLYYFGAAGKIVLQAAMHPKSDK